MTWNSTSNSVSMAWVHTPCTSTQHTHTNNDWLGVEKKNEGTKLIECVSYLLCSFDLICEIRIRVKHDMLNNESKHTALAESKQTTTTKHQKEKNIRTLDKVLTVNLTTCTICAQFYYYYRHSGRPYTLAHISVALCNVRALARTTESCAQAGVVRTMVGCQPEIHGLPFNGTDSITSIYLCYAAHRKWIVCCTESGVCVCVCKNRKQQTHWTPSNYVNCSPRLLFFGAENITCDPGVIWHNVLFVFDGTTSAQWWIVCCGFYNDCLFWCRALTAYTDLSHTCTASYTPSRHSTRMFIKIKSPKKKTMAIARIASQILTSHLGENVLWANEQCFWTLNGLARDSIMDFCLSFCISLQLTLVFRLFLSVWISGHRNFSNLRSIKSGILWWMKGKTTP